MVLRRTSFAAHAYAEIGFAGAAGAATVRDKSAFWTLAASILGGLGIAILGKRASHRDVEIGTVLAFALGLGLCS